MKKKILAGLLSAMMVVSLAACGSSETGATTTDSKSETTANTADGTAAAATDAQGSYQPEVQYQPQTYQYQSH